MRSCSTQQLGYKPTKLSPPYHYQHTCFLVFSPFPLGGGRWFFKKKNYYHYDQYIGSTPDAYKICKTPTNFAIPWFKHLVNWYELKWNILKGVLTLTGDVQTTYCNCHSRYRRQCYCHVYETPMLCLVINIITVYLWTITITYWCVAPIDI